MENVLGPLIPIMAIIFTFGIPGLIIFWAIHVKHQERMRLIEKGLPPEEMKAYFTSVAKPRSPYAALRWGIILSFIGLGIIVSIILENAFDIEQDITFAIILFAGGLGFLTYYLIIRSKKNGDVSSIASASSTSSSADQHKS